MDNTLSCGCVVSVSARGTDAKQREYVDIEIRQCPLHKAAPGLLAACKELLKNADEGSNDIVGRDENGHSLNACGMARMRARIAIAKAEG